MSIYLCVSLLYELFTQKYSSCAQVVYSSTFLPEGIVLGFWNFEWGFNSQENKIWVELKNLGLNNTLGDYVQLRHFYWSKMDLLQRSVMFYHKKMNPIMYDKNYQSSIFMIKMNQKQL